MHTKHETGLLNPMDQVHRMDGQVCIDFGVVDPLFKVEKILKGSLDSIPSPSVKIQIMGGKVCLRYKGKAL